MEDQRVKEFWSSTSCAPKRPSQGFPLIAPQYFRITVRRKMLYEQGLDFESFQSFLSQTSDPIKSRFYDDLLTVASSENPWKLPKRLCGLPTPPSTPEHSVENSDGKPAREKALFVVEPKSSYATRTLISNGLQVVPDSIPDESNVQDIIPWLSECEQQKLNAVYTSVVDGNNNEQQYPADNPTCVHTYSRAKPVPFSSALDPSNKECASPPGRMDTLPVYQSCLKNTDQYSSGSLYTSHLTDQLCQKPHVSMSPTHDPVPDCMISPVSPSRSLKRPYYQPAIPVIHSATSMPLDRVTRELFAHEYGEYHVAQSPRSTHQQYYRQLAYERLRAQHKAEDVDVSGTQNEPELSRATHNVLERQRRNDLKLRFSMLRDTIPELVNNDKAPKIQILKKSLEYLAELKSQEQRLLADLELEKQRKIILLRRLHALSQETYNY